jgi:hypothetical protein
MALNCPKDAGRPGVPKREVSVDLGGGSPFSIGAEAGGGDRDIFRLEGLEGAPVGRIAHFDDGGIQAIQCADGYKALAARREPGMFSAGNLEEVGLGNEPMEAIPFPMAQVAGALTQEELSAG